MGRKRNTREFCQDAVCELLESSNIEFHIQYDQLVDRMNRAADAGNNDLGQLRAFLAPLGEGSDEYRGAVGAYVRTMASTGNHNRALRAAAEFAGMTTPPEDLGPVDKVFDAFQRRTDQPGATGFIAGVGRFVRRHAQPRRPEHN
jgi:hypothetical protein